MNDNLISTLIFSGVGLLFILISLPLIKGIVPPNSFYGCRTRKTLSDENIWYKANRISGYDLLVTGAITLFTSFSMFAIAREMNADYFTLTLLVVMLASLMGAVLHSLRALKRM